MTREDDRTIEERTSHWLAVVGTDSFMSGWGGAAGGASYAAWACRPDDVRTVEQWVSSRREMRRVRVVTLGDWRPRAAHVHIYVVNDGHPALGRCAQNHA